MDMNRIIARSIQGLESMSQANMAEVVCAWLLLCDHNYDHSRHGTGMTKEEWRHQCEKGWSKAAEGIIFC